MLPQLQLQLQLELHGAWVTLVDLSDEILCLPVSVCYQFGRLGGKWQVASGKGSTLYTGRFVLPRGRLAQAELIFK